MKSLWLVIAWEDWDLASKDSFMMVAKDRSEIENRISRDGYYTNFNATEINEVDGYDIKLEKCSYWKSTCNNYDDIIVYTSVDVYVSTIMVWQYNG